MTMGTYYSQSRQVVSQGAILSWPLPPLPWLSLNVWVPLSAPPRSSVQRPSMQFYTRPHLSVNLSVPFLPGDVRPPAPSDPVAPQAYNPAVTRDVPACCPVREPQRPGSYVFVFFFLIYSLVLVEHILQQVLRKGASF